MKFKIGDKVKWTSQASGSTKEKFGEIVMIVPKKTDFLKIEKSLQKLGKKFSSKYGGGFNRISGMAQRRYLGNCYNICGCLVFIHLDGAG